MRRLAIAGVLAVLTVVPVCGQSLEERLPACFDCHGENGQSQQPGVPSLGAQPSLYSLIQMVMFRDRLRITDPMNDVAKGLSDDELRKTAELISRLPPPPPLSDGTDHARMDRARALVAKYRCNFCHQTNFQGADNVPRLAGQREDYLLRALRSYRDNSRPAYEAQMSQFVYGLNDEDFADLAYFLARVN
jgi:cytochrome c553